MWEVALKQQGWPGRDAKAPFGAHNKAHNNQTFVRPGVASVPNRPPRQIPVLLPSSPHIFTGVLSLPGRTWHGPPIAASAHVICGSSFAAPSRFTREHECVVGGCIPSFGWHTPALDSACRRMNNQIQVSSFPSCAAQPPSVQPQQSGSL